MQKVDFLRLEYYLVQIRNLLNVADSVIRVGLGADLEGDQEGILEQVVNLNTITRLTKEKLEELECLCLTYLEALEAQKSKEVVR